MGFLSGLISATVKTVLTPVAIIKDAVEVVNGDEPNTTKGLLNSVANDAGEAFDDLLDGDLL